MKSTIVIIILMLALSTLGSDCINENFLVVVNIEGISGTYSVNRGDNSFGPPTDCSTIDPSEYLSDDFSNYRNVRVTDIRVRTIGSFGANLQNGRLLVNGTEIMRYSGPWNSFNTPQSLLTSPLIDRTNLNIAYLASVLESQQPVTICGQGTLSQNVDQDGLAVEIIVFAQVDAEVE